jgi:predicted metal-dependent phosphoesterase TrpH
MAEGLTAPRFDLQSHSTYSDGSLAPAEVVARAAAAGVELLALTDHDSVGGVAEALRAAEEHGLALSPATELSSVHGAYEDLHILGYELDHTDPDLLAALHDFQGDRSRRVAAMADRMRELEFELGDEPIKNGRPHLARALLRHNAERLHEEGIDGPDTLFPAYLVPGAPGYVRRTHPTVREAIEVIHAAGGIAVWAHPFWDVEDAVSPLDEFTGLDGVEVFYTSFTREQTEALYAEVTRRGLLTTGSADFHGPEHDRFNTFRNFQTYGLTPHLGEIGRRRGRRSPTPGRP